MLTHCSYCSLALSHRFTTVGINIGQSTTNINDGPYQVMHVDLNRIPGKNFEVLYATNDFLRMCSGSSNELVFNHIWIHYIWLNYWLAFLRRGENE